MYSRSSEPVRFERDCEVVMVPQGETVTLPAGSVGYITQALGGSWTVFVEGNLFRVAGRDADAIGKEPPEPLQLPAGKKHTDEFFGDVETYRERLVARLPGRAADGARVMQVQ